MRQMTHPTEVVQEGGDEVLGLAYLNAWPLGQPPGRKAIDDAVSHPLGLLTLLWQHCPVCMSQTTAMGHSQQPLKTALCTLSISARKRANKRRATKRIG